MQRVYFWLEMHWTSRCLTQRNAKEWHALLIKHGKIDIIILMHLPHRLDRLIPALFKPKLRCKNQSTLSNQHMWHLQTFFFQSEHGNKESLPEWTHLLYNRETWTALRTALLVTGQYWFVMFLIGILYFYSCYCIINHWTLSFCVMSDRSWRERKEERRESLHVVWIW